MKKLLIMSMLISFIFYQCSIFGDFDSPKVVTVTPIKDSINIDKVSSVIIQFSEPMEKPITEKAFSLKTGGNTVTGYFTWSENDKKMTFTPEYPLNPGNIYYISLTESSEDKVGNNLDGEINYQFTVGGETVKPYVVSTYPVYGAIGIPKEANILITFSEAIDETSLINGVTFSPEFQYQLSLQNNETTAFFNPVGLLEYGTTYNVDVNNEVKDKEGNSLLEAYKFVFTVGDDFTSPALVFARNSSSTVNWNSSVINNNVEKDDSILFNFSKPMNKASTGNYITFSPSVAGNFLWDNDYQVRFTPADIFNLLGVYTVSISHSLSDTNGNELEDEYSFLFMINGTNSIPPVVNKISDTINDPWVNNQFISIETNKTYTNINIHFSQGMHQIRVIDNLDVEYIGGTGSGIGLGITKYIWNSPTDTILKIDLKGLDSGNLYKLEIKGGKDGATDKNNNYLIEDFVIFFKT